MLHQLNYTVHTTRVTEEEISMEGLRGDNRIIVLLKQSRKGMVKATVEVEKPIKCIADYEERKRLEISLIASLDAYTEVADEYTLGV